MSSEALSWAFKQDIKPSSLKFTLVAMCECANYQTGRIFASIAHLSEITGQDRKTVIANMGELEKRSLIEDTGERVGKTMQVKVYRAVIGTVPEAEQYRKRNSTVPVVKESQKRDTEPSFEPSTPQNSNEFCTSPDGNADEDDLFEAQGEEAESDKLKPEHFVDAWNDLAARLSKPRVRNLTPERRVLLKARIAGYSLEDFREVLGNVEASPFLRGDRQWNGCTFDWVMKKANFQKILEGNYNEQSSPSPNWKSGSARQSAYPVC